MWDGETGENLEVAPEPDSAGESVPLASELEAAPGLEHIVRL